MMTIAIFAVDYQYWWSMAADSLVPIVLFGGPVAGAWLGRRRGGKGCIAGGVIGGVAPLTLILMVGSLVHVYEDPTDIGLPVWRQVVMFLTYSIAIGGGLGLVAGILIGSVLHVAFATARRCSRGG